MVIVDDAASLSGFITPTVNFWMSIPAMLL
jgi:hypothetical protein